MNQDSLDHKALLERRDPRELQVKRGLRNSNERKHEMSRPVRAKESFEIHHIFGQLSVF